jgi:isopentenyldiphosphate isomerase
MPEEVFDIVDSGGRVIGAAPRARCHGDPSLLHRVVHCLAMNRQGELLLQLRSPRKDIQPGKWDTSVGGHVAQGETIEATLTRELAEEIGVEAASVQPDFLYRYVHANAIESEMVWTFACRCEGPFRRHEEEIEDLRFWPRPEIEAALGSGCFTPNFEEEYRRFRKSGR